MSTSSAPASGAAASLSSASWGAEFRALFKLGWPLVVAQLAQISLFATDTVMLGWLGPKYLASVALANALFVATQLFGIGVVGAVAPMVAQALGANDPDSVRRTVRQGVWVALLLTVVLFPVIWNIAPIYRMLGEDPNLINLAEGFIHYAVWLLPAALLTVVFRSLLAAHGNTRAIFFITVAGVIVNALLDYALIFGNWGFPRLELAGSGIATTLVSFVMLAIMVGYTLLHPRFRPYRIMHNFFKADWPRFVEMLRIGIPIGLMQLAEVLLFTSASLLQGWIGQDAVAAHAIALQLASISFMVPLGLSQAATVRVGIAYGARNPDGVRKAGWAALAGTLIFMSATAILFLVIPQPLVHIFLSPSPENAAAIQLAVSYLLIAGLFQLVDGTQVTMGAALRGLSDTNVPLFIALFGYWAIGFPVAYIFAFPLGFKGVGIWFGLAAGLAAVAVILVVRFAMRDRLGLTERAA